MASTLVVNKIKGGSSGVALTLPTDAGTADYLLKTDGVGTLSWAADGGGIASLAADTTPQLGGFLDANGNYMQTEKGADIVSASPLVITTAGDYFDVTGTVSFAVMTVAADRQFTLQFDGILTMTHHATNLDLPGEANITTAAGDVATFQSTGANTVQCINYTKANGESVVAAGGGKVLQVVKFHTQTQGSTTYSTSDTAFNPSIEKAITPIGSGSNFLIAVRWFGECEETWNCVVNVLRGSSRINSNTGLTGLCAPLNTHATNFDSTPDIINFTTLDTTGSTAGTAITFKLVIREEAVSRTLWTNRMAGGGSNEEGTSEMIITEIGA